MRYSVSAMALAATLLAAGCSEAEEQNAVEANAAEAPADDGTSAEPKAPPPGDNQIGEGADSPQAGGADDGGGDDDEDGLAIIPARFHGQWNGDRTACGTGASETRLRVDGDSLRFYESVGNVRRVEVEGERVIIVTAEYRGEGQTWQNERRLSLSADGNSLTVTGDGSRLVRYRCG